MSSTAARTRRKAISLRRTNRPTGTAWPPPYGDARRLRRGRDGDDGVDRRHRARHAGVRREVGQHDALPGADLGGRGLHFRGLVASGHQFVDAGRPRVGETRFVGPTTWVAGQRLLGLWRTADRRRRLIDGWRDRRAEGRFAALDRDHFRGPFQRSKADAIAGLDSDAHRVRAVDRVDFGFARHGRRRPEVGKRPARARRAVRAQHRERVCGAFFRPRAE